MSEPISMPTAAIRARVMSAALALGRSSDLWSLALVILTLFGLLWMSLSLVSISCLLFSILAGGTQKIFALRVAFDEALFRHWAEKWSSVATPTSDSTTITADLVALDQTLFVSGLLPAPGEVVQDLDSRLQGALRLLKKQILALAIQLAAMVIAILLHL